MTELYGQCSRCGGSNTAGHVCIVDVLPAAPGTRRSASTPMDLIANIRQAHRSGTVSAQDMGALLQIIEWQQAQIQYLTRCLEDIKNG